MDGKGGKQTAALAKGFDEKLVKRAAAQGRKGQGKGSDGSRGLPEQSRQDKADGGEAGPTILTNLDSQGSSLVLSQISQSAAAGDVLTQASS